MTKEPLVNAAYPSLLTPPRWPAGCSCAGAGYSRTDAPGRAAGQDLKITKFHLFKPLFMQFNNLHYYKSLKLPTSVQTISYPIPKLIHTLIFIAMSSTSSISLARRWFFEWIVVFVFITPLKVPILFIILSYEIMKGHACENYFALLWHQITW
jgi:hypothetical protein